MKWYDLISGQISSDIFERGEGCCEQVLSVKETVFGWQGLVRGGDNPFYEVNFYMARDGGNEWSVECNCGHHEINGRVCKHIVAVAIVLDRAAIS